MDAEELFTTARMARLSLKPSEVEKLRLAVERMLGYFAQLKDLDVDSLKPTTHALAGENRVREDIVSEPKDAEPLLKNAPQREERFIVIPNVL
jgi:aspartyl-tRNA(Asn)/glutamyl-tRNA(Gln) amidotransferase subunit C